MIDFQENAEKQKEVSIEVFTTVTKSIKKTQKKLMKEIEARRNAEQKRFEKLANELQQEIDELQKKSAELQQLALTEDHIAFHQVHTLKMWSGPTCEYMNVSGCIPVWLNACFVFWGFEKLKY